MRAVNSSKVTRFVRNNALGLVLVATFVVVWLAGQTSAGLRVYNQQRHDAGLAPIGWPQYLTTSHFGEATFENWESEFLQMAMYVVLTVSSCSGVQPSRGRSRARRTSTKTRCFIATTPTRRGRCVEEVGC